MSQPTVAAARGDRVRIVLETTLRLDATATSGRVYIEGEDGGTHSVPAAQIVESSVIKAVEPLNFGAVALDDAGRKWVRMCDDDEPWASDGGEMVETQAWSDFAEATVLFEGVKA